MIIGIGNDIVSVSRVRKACLKERFKTRCFTSRELEYCGTKGNMAGASLAGLFAAKEAVAKALGTGFCGFGPIDVEVLRDDLGKPYAQLHGKAAELSSGMGAKALFVSISHCDEYAVATAVIA